MLWVEELFKTKYPVIGMCHLKSLPSDPTFNKEKGISYIVESAKNDINILQNEGFHGILISNEFSLPYSQKISQITVATMARIIGELRNFIQIPFGVDCMYDAKSTIDLAIATDSDFYRITLKSESVSDYEYGISDLSQVFRYAYINRFKIIRNIVNINLPLDLAIINDDIIKLIKTIMFQFSPDSISISSNLLNIMYFNTNDIIGEVLKQAFVFCDGGCNVNNLNNILKCSNGIIVGTDIKDNHQISNSISSLNARKFLNAVNYF